MIDAIKELRLEIDAVANFQIISGGINLSYPEIIEYKKSMLLAKAWLGKILQFLETPSPYKNDGNRNTISDIEPTADKAAPDDFTLERKEYYTLNHIQQVDYLRERVKNLTFVYANLHKNTAYPQQVDDNIITHLTQARFWLGFTLQTMRSLEVKDATPAI